RARLGKAETEVDLGGANVALALLAPVTKEAGALGEAVQEVRAAEATARASLEIGKVREAESAAREGLRLATRFGFEAGLYRLDVLLARIASKKGDPRSAAASYAEAARRIAALRAGLD